MLFGQKISTAQLSTRRNELSAPKNDDEPVFESGRVVLYTGNLEVLEVKLTSKKIDLNMEDKDFVKRIIKMRGEFSTHSPIDTQEQIANEVKKKKTSSPIKILKTVAEALSDRGITLTVSYKSSIIITVGADAKPTILPLITKTRAVAINNPFRALRMII
jgi:hypothetical protein